ncbi:MAG: serine/threonine protein kinase [Phycisphaerales bacterium]|nr:serine/threonine protein kinase [Phycisphaerales bacterium]
MKPDEPWSSAVDGGSAPLPDPIRALCTGSLEDGAWFRQVAEYVQRPILGHVGPFELLVEAGRGGQGVVYRARQSRPARDVALKRLAAGVFATPAMRARFEREIEAAAALNHPNIVAVFGAQDVDGQLIVALQWIDGVPLDAWARPAGTRPRDISEVVGVFRKICDAVQHAHQRGVIHRDLKPSNVLVDAAGEPHVLDFGLAARPDDSAATARLTFSGAMLGTPAFAPPEQLRCAAAKVDVRSDVYSLGAMMFLCLAGEPPVDPKLPPGELARCIEREGPRPLERLAPGIGRELCAIVRKALQAEPRNRYASVDALRLDLERYVRGEPVLAHPPTLAYHLRKFALRHRVTVGFALGYVLLATAATAISTTLYWRAEQERSRADSEAQQAQVALGQATRESHSAFAIREFLQNMLLSAGRTGSVQGPTLTVREMLDRASERLDHSSTRMDAAAEGALRLTIGDAYRELGLDAAAEPHYRMALERRREVFGEDSAQVAQCLDALGRTYRVLGRPVEAEAAVTGAWEIYVRILPPDSGYLAVTASSMGLVKRSLRKYDEALQWYHEALRRYTECWGPDNNTMPVLHTNLGIVHVHLGQFEQAEAHLRESVERCRSLHQDTPHFDTAWAMSNLADVLTKRGRPASEVEPLYEESQRMLVALHGREHPRLGLLLQRYARFLSRDGRTLEALELLAAAETIFLANERWGDVLTNTVQVSEVLRDSGCVGEALTRLVDVLVVDAARTTAGDPRAADVHLALGRLLLEVGEAHRATEHLRTAVAIYSAAGEHLHTEAEQARGLLAELEPAPAP